MKFIGQAPTKKREEDAGWDLRSAVDVVLVPGQVTKVPLGTRLELPTGCYGYVTDRSGLGSRGVRIVPGVIDNPYRGELVASMYTLADPYEVKAGDRVCQLVVLPFIRAQFEEASELSETDRGDKGFGSSGR